MSSVSISYDSLKDASDEGKNIAKKLDRYADSIKSDVYNKFNNYDGKWTSNISTARNNIDSKISDLRNKSDKYEIYANNLIDLRDQCKSTDKAVKQKVSTLTATFKTNNGIKNSKIQNTISYFMTSIGNSTAVGRWLGNGNDMIEAGKDYLKECIEDWYQFEGGKDFLKGTLVATLEIAIGVLSVVMAIISGGALLVVIAGVIAGVIAVADGITNFRNEIQAYDATQNNDPATGKRRSSLNTLTDTIRTDSDSKLAHNVATGIDVVNFTCSIITIFASLGDVVKKGYKWTTGCTDDLANIKIKDVITKNNFKDFAGKINSTIRNGWIDVKTAKCTGDWTFFNTLGKDFLSDFANNLKGSYTDFSTIDKKFETTKNIFEGTKSIIEDGFNFENIIKTIAVPNIPIVDLPFAPGEDKEGISVGDLMDIYDGFKDDVVGSTLFANDSLINNDILEKLSKKSDINIAISNINIPVVNINIPKLNIA